MATPTSDIDIEEDAKAFDTNLNGKVARVEGSIKGSSSSKPVIDAETMPLIFDLKLSLGKINLILVNDFSGQNIPILRAILDGIDFIANGTTDFITGDGSIFLGADYFNTSVGSWEPLIEQWHPLISLTKKTNFVKLEVWNDYTLQINLSGAFCKCLYNAASLISRIGKEGSYVSRSQINPLTIVNHLGMPIELLDSKTKKLILTLETDNPTSVPPLSSTSSAGFEKQGTSKTSKLFPSEFEIRLLGSLKEMMFPILHLPLVSSKPRLYSFHPLNELVG
eukprot:gene28547-31871_t